MRTISGLIRPTSGSITMEGTDALATPAHRIISLGIAHVPEHRRDCCFRGSPWRTI